jgi:hypothetical protein
MTCIRQSQQKTARGTEIHPLRDRWKHYWWSNVRSHTCVQVGTMQRKVACVQRSFTWKNPYGRGRRGAFCSLRHVKSLHSTHGATDDCQTLRATPCTRMETMFFLYFDVYIMRCPGGGDAAEVVCVWRWFACKEPYGRAGNVAVCSLCHKQMVAHLLASVMSSLGSYYIRILY